MSVRLSVRIAGVLASLLVIAGGGRLAHAAEPPTFEQDVLPILRAKCLNCHGGDEPRRGLDLRTRAGFLKGGRSGPAVRPGSLRESLLWGYVATDKMPAEGEKLDDDEKAVLRRWLVAGAPDKTHPPIARREAAGLRATKQGVEATATAIDRLIEERLRKHAIAPAALADDATFLRRVFLDLNGTIPDDERTRAFLDDTRKDKRARLVDELLDSPEYGRHLAIVWHRLLIPKSAGAYRRIPHRRFKEWLANEFNEGHGWDEIVTALITAEGYLPSNKENANTRKQDQKRQPQNVATAFLNVHNTEGRPQPKGIVASVSRLFLAQSIECAQCHNHPLAKWRNEDFWAAAAFFERVRYERAVFSDSQVGRLSEPAEGKPLEQHDEKAARHAFVPGVYGEPVIDMEDPSGKRTGQMIRARLLDGTEPEMSPDESYRAVFAEWVVATENPFFARAMANRVWARLTGRGFAEPVDDLSEDNPVSHPEILELLAAEFAGSGYDLKHLHRCIVRSRTYQRASVPAEAPETEDAAAIAERARLASSLFAHQSLRQLTEEQLVAALTVAIPTFAERLEEDRRDKNPGLFLKDFLEVFEAGDGPSTDYTRGLQQALRMMNGDGKLFHHGAVEHRLSAAASVAENVESLYLQVLSRRPRPEESQRMVAYVEAAEATLAEERAALKKSGKKPPKPNPKDPPQSPYSDLLWVLVNSGEFVFNH